MGADEDDLEIVSSDEYGRGTILRALLRRYPLSPAVRDAPMRRNEHGQAIIPVQPTDATNAVTWAIVDECDYYDFIRIPWVAGRFGPVADTQLPFVIDDKVTLTHRPHMHQMFWSGTRGIFSWYLNKNSLDNRRSNLKLPGLCQANPTLVPHPRDFAIIPAKAKLGAVKSWWVFSHPSYQLPEHWSGPYTDLHVAEWVYDSIVFHHYGVNGTSAFVNRDLHSTRAPAGWFFHDGDGWHIGRHYDCATTCDFASNIPLNGYPNRWIAAWAADCATLGTQHPPRQHLLGVPRPIGWYWNAQTLRAEPEQARMRMIEDL